MREILIIILCVLICVAISAVVVLGAMNGMNRCYDNGLQAGERIGFDKGFSTCYNELGIHWLASYNRFFIFAQEYGNIYNTPWAKFTDEEKIVIAMYGGSGSKLSKEVFGKLINKYGAKEDLQELIREYGYYPEYTGDDNAERIDFGSDMDDAGQNLRRDIVQ